MDSELERYWRPLAILFVDIAGSTNLYDKHVAVADVVTLPELEDLLRPLIESHTGTVVKAIGSAILARFNGAETAVRCAVAMQHNVAEWNRERSLSDRVHVRVAINFGWALLKENDVFGDVVNLTSRIESATEPDEIAISPSVYQEIQHLSEIRIRKKASGAELKGEGERLDLYVVLWRPSEMGGPPPPRPPIEQPQSEPEAEEIDALLATAREQAERFARHREEIAAHVLQLLQSGKAAKAAALFVGLPQTYFKDKNFHRAYSKTTFILTAVEHVEKSLTQEDLVLAESLVEHALRPYPDDPTLLALQKRVREEDLRLRRLRWGELLEQAQVALGQMEYKRAIELLSSVSWESAEPPDLAKQAESLLEQAQRRAREAAVAKVHSCPDRMEIAHVLFVDIVGYSRLPMDQQKQILRQLQELVRRTGEFARAQASKQLIRLPTGDGMALVFFGDAEAPVRCALELSRVLKDGSEIRLRMGVHAGPVYRVADINANRNVAGGGINIAQRVMDCGDAGHILVSKTVADVLGQVSTWTSLLHDLGEAEVKHGVRVHLYNLYTKELGNPEVPQKLQSTQREKKRRVSLGVSAAALVLVLVLALAAIGRWRRYVAAHREGYVQLSAAPWAQVVSVRTAEGEPMDISGETPIQIRLAPGEYIIQLKNGEDTEEETVKVEAGKTHPLTHTFRKVKIDDLVQELLSR